MMDAPGGTPCRKLRVRTLVAAQPFAGSALRRSDLLRLKRLTTPTIYNGWEQISAHDRRTVVNREDVRDFLPRRGRWSVGQ